FWSRSASIGMSLLYMVLGLVLILFPGVTGTVFCWVLAIASLAYAVSRFWFFYRARKEGYTAAGTLTIGLLLAAFGIFCFARPDVILSFLPLTLGILLLIDGIGKLPLAIDGLSLHSPYRFPLLFSALIPLALGIVLIADPFGAAKTVIVFFGISLLVDGLMDLITAIQTRRAEKSEYKDIR
ncbi:MAG: HdeD family acid-resistance protein, partial [Hominenteromicrobium sp.]